MTRKEQIKILDNKIKANERQYDLDRINAEISAYSRWMKIILLSERKRY